MPMVRLTIPAGSLTEEGRESVRSDLAAVLPRWHAGTGLAARAKGQSSDA